MPSPPVCAPLGPPPLIPPQNSPALRVCVGLSSGTGSDSHQSLIRGLFDGYLRVASGLSPVPTEVPDPGASFGSPPGASQVFAGASPIPRGLPLPSV